MLDGRQTVKKNKTPEKAPAKLCTLLKFSNFAYYSTHFSMYPTKQINFRFSKLCFWRESSQKFSTDTSLMSVSCLQIMLFVLLVGLLITGHLCYFFPGYTALGVPGKALVDVSIIVSQIGEFHFTRICHLAQNINRTRRVWLSRVATKTKWPSHQKYYTLSTYLHVNVHFSLYKGLPVILEWWQR